MNPPDAPLTPRPWASIIISRTLGDPLGGTRRGGQEEWPAAVGVRPTAGPQLYGAYRFCDVMMISTRRFLARPWGVSFEATGRVSPKPCADSSLAGTPCETR